MSPPTDEQFGSKRGKRFVVINRTRARCERIGDRQNPYAGPTWWGRTVSDVAKYVFLCIRVGRIIERRWASHVYLSKWQQTSHQSSK